MTLLETRKINHNGKEIDFKIFETIRDTMSVNVLTYTNVVKYLRQCGYASRQFGTYPRVMKI